MTKIQLFEKTLKKHVEEIVSNEEGVLHNYQDDHNIKVSHITFAFENVKIIKLLA